LYGGVAPTEWNSEVEDNIARLHQSREQLDIVDGSDD
jgi:hypothetical protein